MWSLTVAVALFIALAGQSVRAQAQAIALDGQRQVRAELPDLEVITEQRVHAAFATTAPPAALPSMALLPHPPRWPSISSSSSVPSASRSRQDAFDVHWYHLNLNMDIDRDPELIGHVRVMGRAIDNLDTLDLDLAASMEVVAVLSGDGSPLTWTRGTESSENKLLVMPDGGLASGSEAAIDIVYRGNPKWDGSRGGYASGRRSGGDPYIWTLSEPYGSLQWWPTEDHPADKADSVRVTLTVPEGMVAASNGVLQSEHSSDNGTVTFDWLHRHPIATYLVSIAAADYDRVHDTYIRPTDLVAEFGPAHVPIEHYAYKDIPAVEGIGPTSGWHLTKHAMAIQERWFGPYPFADEKYGNAHVTFRGGMEHQTLSSMGNIGIELIAHELAHQWYGDAVTPASWRDLWLNEGFATLGEMLTFEADPDYTPVRQILFDIYYERARTASGTLVLADTSNALDMFAHGRVYAKGWMVLRMIRSRIGDSAFRSLLRTWAAHPDVQYGTATTLQFKETVEAVTAENWDRFFEQWVFEGTGEPRFSLGWEDISSNAGAGVRLRLYQVQDAVASNVQAFALRLPMWIETDEATYQVLVDIDQREEVIDVPLPARPRAVHLDPERWILRGQTQLQSGTFTETTLPGALEVSIAPHPAHGSIQVAIEADPVSGREASVELYDLVGRRVWQGTVRIQEAGVRLAIPPPAAGRYLLRVRTDRQVSEQLVVVGSN